MIDGTEALFFVACQIKNVWLNPYEIKLNMQCNVQYVYVKQGVLEKEGTPSQ